MSVKVTDLSPQFLKQYRDAPMTMQQLKFYKELKNEMLVEAAGEEITAVNAAVIEVKVVGAALPNTGEAAAMILLKPSKRLKLGLPLAVSPCHIATSKVCAITAAFSAPTCSLFNGFSIKASATNL